MKNLFKNLLTITVLSLVIASCSKCKDVTPPAPTNYTVTFNLNGGSGAASPLSGTSVILPASSASTFFFTGYTFKEWNTKSDGTGTGYAAGSSYTVSGNVTLYAIWQAGASYTVTFNLNGGTGVANPATVLAGGSTVLPSSSASTFYFTNYNFVNWNTAANGSGTSYSAGASYIPTGNVTLYAIWQSAYTAVFTATDESTVALLRVLPGSSVNKVYTLNVTTAGTVKLDCNGTLTNGNLALSYYWVISKDSMNYTSNLNTIIPKTAMQPSQVLTLPLGKNVIIVKTAAYAGLITNGTPIGVSLKGANNVSVSSSGFTADASHNAAKIVKVNCKFANGKTEAFGQNSDDVWSYLQITPFSDESGTVYDGTSYPSIYTVSFDTKVTGWFTGNFTGYTNLDFTNTTGPLGQNFNMIQTNGTGGNSSVYGNGQAVFSSGILTFYNSTSVQLIKSNLGNYAYVRTSANTYSYNITFGPANVSWYLKYFFTKDNEETQWIAPDGTRIY